MTSGELVMLENLRFHPEEEKNDSAFATELAQLADLFVLEAFGTAHRRHASIVGIPKLLPSAPGILLQSELSMLGKVLEAPTKPLAAILGGAKISDKIKILDNLLDKLDVLIIGGGMASNFLKAKGLNIGKSLVEDDGEQLAREIITRSASLKVELSLPIDIIVGNEFKPDPETVKTVKIDEIEDDFMILDIGPKTISLFLEQLSRSKTILWNGPLGVCEFDMFSKGTKHVAETLACLDAFSIIGGGSTASAIEELGISAQLGYISTGGAAMLEFLEGKVLPGVAALSQHSN
jgi:phosphoglycerate kinase